MAVLAIIIYTICVGVGLGAAWVIITPSENLDHLKELEKQRSMLAYQIAYDMAHTDWLTKWRFSKHIKKGGGRFL